MADVEFFSPAPNFQVRDVVKAAEHYRDVFGFCFDRYWGEPPCFVIVSRGRASFMLFSRDEGAPTPNGTRTKDWDAYIWVSDADALCDQFRAAGADIVRTPEDQPYGVREFEVQDLDGYLLCLGHDLPAPEK
jgi:predicted enzyme related to lactoylglutathione lyase